jgi:hypothetical protein
VLIIKRHPSTLSGDVVTVMKMEAKCNYVEQIFVQPQSAVAIVTLSGMLGTCDLFSVFFSHVRWNTQLSSILSVKLFSCPCLMFIKVTNADFRLDDEQSVYKCQPNKSRQHLLRH